MPVDIKALRDDPDTFRESERYRFRNPDAIDAFLEVDARWRAETHRLNSLRSDLAQLQSQIAQRKKASAGRDACTDELAKKTDLDADIALAEQSLGLVSTARAEILARLGNLVCPRVPRARGEEGNVVLRSWGAAVSSKALQHWDALRRLAAWESERGTRIAGRRGYFLRGCGVVLNMALQSYGIAFLAGRQYIPLQPPYFMRKDVMSKTAELHDFDEQLYKVIARDANGGTDPSYLIATSEQPISALHQDELLKPADLPLRYAGISPCFRAETGSHGLDAKGLFRVHQFEKVEQFCICTPEQSWKLFEEMLGVAEEFYQSLGVPYRIVAIASGALNNAAAMKYDLEAWFPGSGEYRELVSCSNCTDFQARALGVRLDEGAHSRYAHMLNATLCATERTLCCLLENHQEPGGVRVPRVLVPYMHGQEFLHYQTTS